MNTVYLHNGNTKINEWIKKQHSTRVMPCIDDCWTAGLTKLDTLDQRIEYIKTCSDLVFSVLPSSCINNLLLASLKDCCVFVKIFTTHQYDLENLDPSWDLESYTYSQWVRCCSDRLWLSDRHIYYKWINPKQVCSSIDQVVFTPGRCGSTVLKNVLNLEHLVHHNDQLLDNKHRFNQLLETDTLCSVLRKDFYAQVCSVTIATQIQLVTTTLSTLTENASIFVGKVVHVTDDSINFTFDQIVHYVDILLALHLLWNKRIRFCYFEDLSPYFESLKTQKNPYITKDIITNYNDMKEKVNLEIQPIYSKILQKIESFVGVNIY